MIHIDPYLLAIVVTAYGIVCMAVGIWIGSSPERKKKRKNELTRRNQNGK